FGRYLQIAFSIVGLVGFPLQTIISALILYYMFRPGVRTMFSGRRASELSAAEIQAVRTAQSQHGVGIAVLVGLVAVVPMTGIVAAIAIPNFLTAVDRGKQKRTMADMRSIATAIESYKVDHDVYPSVRTIEALQPLVQPAYIQPLPTVDGWGHSFQ